MLWGYHSTSRESATLAGDYSKPFQCGITLAETCRPNGLKLTDYSTETQITMIDGAIADYSLPSAGFVGHQAETLRKCKLAPARYRLRNLRRVPMQPHRISTARKSLLHVNLGIARGLHNSSKLSDLLRCHDDLPSCAIRAQDRLRKEAEDCIHPAVRPAWFGHSSHLHVAETGT